MKKLNELLENYIRIHATYMYWNGIYNYTSDTETKSNIMQTMLAIEAMEKPVKDEFNKMLYYSDLEEEWLEKNSQYSDIYDYWHNESCKRAEAMRQANNINLDSQEVEEV